MLPFTIYLVDVSFIPIIPFLHFQSRKLMPFLVLSVDAMDISGEHQLDVDHNIFKKRLDQYGNALVAGPTRHEGKNELD